VDVHTWIGNDLDNLRSKLTGSVLSVVPRQRWVEHIDDGGSSIAYLLLHLARHHDLAIATVIRNKAPLFEAHRQAIGLSGAAAHVGLPETEDPAATATMSLDALAVYADSVFDATTAWLARVGTLALDTNPDAAQRLTQHAGLSADEVGWLYRMWTGKAVWWFVQWPVIGHGHAHTGEAISVRNRMGLSPF
jgi:hypothetical protein